MRTKIREQGGILYLQLEIQLVEVIVFLMIGHLQVESIVCLLIYLIQVEGIVCLLIGHRQVEVKGYSKIYKLIVNVICRIITLPNPDPP
jgi:hypothetical protein